AASGHATAAPPSSVMNSRPRRRPGRRLSQEEAAPRLRARHRGRRCVVDRPSTFLFKDPGSVLKGGVNVCQRQVVNEVLGSLITEFVRNFGREDATPYQRSPHASLLVRIWAVKLIRHSFERHAPSPFARYPGGADGRRRVKAGPTKLSA